MKKELHVYSTGPIDIWDGWIPMLHFLSVPIPNYDVSEFTHAHLNERSELVHRFCQACQLARSIGWEGDFRQGPYVSAIPAGDSECHSELLIAWKQDNNGTTFIASPFALPWMGNADHRVEQDS